MKKLVILLLSFLVIAQITFGQTWTNKLKAEVVTAHFQPDVKLNSVLKKGELSIKLVSDSLIVSIKLKKIDEFYGEKLVITSKSLKINANTLIIDGFTKNPKAKKNDKKQAKPEKFKMTLKISSTDEEALKKLLKI